MSIFEKIFNGGHKKKTNKKKDDTALQAYNRGQILLKLNQCEQALVAYDIAERIWEEEINSLIPNDDEQELKRLTTNIMNIWYSKVYANYMLERYDISLALIERSLEKAPDEPEFLLRKGFVLYAAQRYEESLTWIETALNKNRDLSEAWYYKGNILRDIGNYDAALEAFEQSISCSKPLHFQFPRFTWIPLNPSSKLKKDIAESWYCKGEIFHRQKRYNEALEAINEALSIKPGLEDAERLRATVLKEMENTKT